MPNSLSYWILSLLPVGVVVGSGIYAAVHHARGRLHRKLGIPPAGSYPGSREHVGDLNLSWWRSLSTAEQAALDAYALKARDAVEAAEVHAEEAARAAAERAAVVNVLYRP